MGGLQTRLETELEKQSGFRRAVGACAGGVHVHDYAVLVGGMRSLPRDAGLIPVRTAGSSDRQHPLLAPAGAVSAENVHPSAKCLLFCIKYFWRVLGVGLLQLGYWTVFVLFAPWTLLLLPVLGVWYILFLSQFLIYTQMNEAFSIEELYQSG